MQKRRSNQRIYEATDLGSRSFVGSNEPVRNGCGMDVRWYMKYFIYHLR